MDVYPLPEIGKEWEELLASLRIRIPEIARAVAADLGEAGAGLDPGEVVTRLLGILGPGGRVPAAEALRLRADGAAAARAGRPLAEPLDAWLSTAWVVWEHATGPESATKRAAPVAGPELLAELGSVLLRVGDDVAAALADGYTGAERALAARAGATRRAVLDELLAPAAGAVAESRRARRATLVGLDPRLPYGLVLVRGRSELADEGPEAEEVGRRLARDPARRPHLVSVRDGDLVLVIAGPWREPGPAAAALLGVADGAWWAVAAPPGPLDALPNAWIALLDAARVLPSARPPGEIHAVADLALERALVADPILAAAAVERWLGPLLTASRGGEALVATLDAWLASGSSILATARALGVAPRTVGYRLERIARLLGHAEIDADLRPRLAATLLIRRLLGGTG